MNKNKKLINAFLVSTMMLSGLALDVSAAEKDAVTRLGGDTRVETSVEVSKAVYTGKSDNVVITGFAGEADALTGTILAANKKAPLLLAKNYSDVKEEVNRLEAKNVYLLGGTSVVSDAFKEAAEADGKKVVRVGGDNRWETAVKMAEQIGTTHKTVFLTNDGVGTGSLADALAVGPVSGDKQIPVLLTAADKMPAETVKALTDFGVEEVIIIGGNGAVSEEVAAELKAKNITVADRVAGDTRWETATEIAATYFGDSEEAIIANDGVGTPIADALMGGYLGANKKAPILLTPAGSLKSFTENYLGGKAMHAYVLGETGAVSATTATAVKKIVDANIEEAKTLKVEAVSTINTMGVEVTFPALEEKLEDVTVEVKNSKGEVVAVLDRDIAKGAKKAFFDFEKNVKSEDLKGAWTVEGVTYDFDELKLIADIVAANTPLELALALEAAEINNVKDTLLAEYTAKIAADNKKADITTLEEIQSIIDATNEGVSTVKDVIDAIAKSKIDTNDVAFYRVLSANFDNVKSDWISTYKDAAVKHKDFDADKNSVAQTDIIDLAKADYARVTLDEIQAAVNRVNLEKANDALTDASNSMKKEDIAKARKMLNDYNDGSDMVKFGLDMVTELELTRALIDAENKTTVTRSLERVVAHDKAMAVKYKDAKDFTYLAANNLSKNSLAIDADIKTELFKDVTINEDYMFSTDNDVLTYASQIAKEVKDNNAAAMNWAKDVRDAVVYVNGERASALLTNVKEADSSEALLKALKAYPGLKYVADANEDIYYAGSANQFAGVTADTIQAKVIEQDIVAINQAPVAKVIAAIEVLELKNVLSANAEAYTLKTFDGTTIKAAQDALDAANNQVVETAQIKVINEAKTVAEVKTALDKLANAGKVPGYLKVRNEDRDFIAAEVLEEREKQGVDKKYDDIADIEGVVGATDEAGALKDHKIALKGVNDLTYTSTPDAVVTALEAIHDEGFDALSNTEKSAKAQEFQAKLKFAQGEAGKVTPAFRSLAEVKALLK